MISIIISDADDDLEQRLKARAVQNRRSIETEARAILRLALGSSEEETLTAANLGDSIRAIVEPVGGLEVTIPPRRKSGWMSD